jgi:hypothetical protein
VPNPCVALFLSKDGFEVRETIHEHGD